MKKAKKSNRTLKLTGCSLSFLVGYLEGKFKDKMTWENYGEWHIDHRRPCASFDLLNEEEQMMCFHYTNLQPMLASENLSKGSKIIYDMHWNGHQWEINRSGIYEPRDKLINKLSMPQRWKSRLLKFYWNEKYFSELLKRLQSNSDIDPVVVAGDKKTYLKMKKENPNKIIAGRSYREIIERYERKINDPRIAETGKYSAKIIREFLKIKCSLKDAPKKLNKFYKKYNLNISVGKDFFPISNLNQKGINFKFSTSNGRGKDVEYYSSFIFSIEVKIKKSIKTIVTGGRYNDLTSKILGLKKIPAVGAAINL